METNAVKVKLMVVGFSGQLAKALAQYRFVEDGVELHCVGRPQVDICDPASIDAAIDLAKPDFVLNAAAYTAVDAAEDDEAKAFMVNAVGVSNLAHSCKSVGAQLIHISTDYVFSGSSNSPLLETDVAYPLSAYGRTKLAGEWAVSSILPNAIIIRASWVYSKFGSNFLKTMLALAEKRNDLSIVNDQIGRPTNILDLCHLISAIIKKLKQNKEHSLGGVYHFSNSGEPVSWHDFALEIFKCADLIDLATPENVIGIKSAEYPTPAIRPKWSVFNIDHVQKTFGYQIPDWQSSLEKHFEDNF